MRILSILMVLQDPHLYHHSLKHIARIRIIVVLRFFNSTAFLVMLVLGIIAVLVYGAVHRAPFQVVSYPSAVSAAYAFEGYVDPAAGCFAFPCCELYEVIAAHAGGEDHFRRRVALVEFEV